MGVRAMAQTKNLTAVGLGCDLLQKMVSFQSLTCMDPFLEPSDLASVGSAQKNSSLKNWCSLKGSKMPSTLMISPVTAPPIKAMARVTSNATNLKQGNSKRILKGKIYINSLSQKHFMHIGSTQICRVRGGHRDVENFFVSNLWRTLCVLHIAATAACCDVVRTCLCASEV